MKNLKVNRNNNITASIVQDSKSLQSKMLPIISILLSAFAIIVSIYTYHDSKKINERIRYEGEITQRIADNKALSFDSNIEFWDYSISNIMQDMIDSNGLSRELSDISLSIADKQTGAALKMLLDNEGALCNDEKYYLLRACLYIRDYILYNDFRFESFISGSLLNKYALPEKLDISEEKYCIVQGILAYYMDDLANAAQHLRSALNAYSKDSPFYDVSNFWLAVLSLRLRSNICDVEVFLDSQYNASASLNILKSSISFLSSGRGIGCTGVPPTFISIYDADDNLIYNYDLPFMIDNPASYLDKDNSEYINNSGWLGTQEKLYFLYNMLFNYTKQLQLQRDIHPTKFGEERYKEFFETLNEFTSQEVFFIDPRITEQEYIKNLSLWFNLYYAFNVECNGLNRSVPIDCIFDRLVVLARIHSTSDTHYDIYTYSKAFELWRNAYDNCGESYKRGCYAALALKYSNYNLTGEEFDTYIAAEYAYESGYRYGYIFDTLIKYYESAGDPSSIRKVSQLQEEREKLHI